MTAISTAIVFDLRSRNMETFTASITQLPSGNLVIRKATELGRLKDLPDGELGLPVIVLGAYRAKTSEGFTGVIAPEHYAGKFVLAGGCGLGWGQTDPETGKRKGDALRPMTDKNGEAFSVFYVPEPTLRKIVGAKNSNVATADAALAGLGILARMRMEIIVEEGQSDYVEAWSLKPKKEGVFRPEFPPEHRLDVFGEGEKIPRYAARIRKHSEPAPADSVSVVRPLVEGVDFDEFVEVDEPKT